jgi:hypothetical protein|tara:strand:+ start:794 stop:1021 length:228 start_codon:yes stop_codon:yes gene_type:complete
MIIKDKFLDNNLTKEQQEVMDDAYEALMSEVKVIDLKLYERLKENELSLADVYKLRNSKEQKKMIRIEDGQYSLL